jgi:aerobic carbon-monoxide dehydrogenase medium subunit
MKSFEIHQPSSLNEACGYLKKENNQIKPMSGGTGLMLMMKSGIFEPEGLVSLEKVTDLNGIDLKENGDLEIKSMTSLSELEHSPIIQNHFSVISQTMKHLANVRVRNVARVGGALAHGDPHMDLPPLLTSLNALVNVKSLKEKRQILLEDFYEGYYTTKLKSDEIIQSVLIPSIKGRHCIYSKCTTRVMDDWPTLGISINLGFENNACINPRIVLSAVVEKPTRLYSVEELLQGRNPNDELLIAASEIATKSIDLFDDARGSADYKSQLIKIYVFRGLKKCLSEKAQP